MSYVYNYQVPPINCYAQLVLRLKHDHDPPLFIVFCIKAKPTGYVLVEACAEAGRTGVRLEICNYHTVFTLALCTTVLNLPNYYSCWIVDVLSRNYLARGSSTDAACVFLLISFLFCQVGSC